MMQINAKKTYIKLRYKKSYQQYDINTMAFSLLFATFAC